jgi:hypothetical protein
VPRSKPRANPQAIALERARAGQSEAHAARDAANALTRIATALTKLSVASRKQAALAHSREADYLALESDLAGREAHSAEGLCRALLRQAERAAAQSVSLRAQVRPRRKRRATPA